MLDDFSVDSSSTTDSPDSSTSPGTQTPAPGAGEQNQQQNQEQVPFHQHPRFRQLTGENRALKNTVSQLTQRLDQLEARGEQRGGSTPDEQRQMQEIAAALKKVFMADPDLKSLYDLRSKAGTFEQASSGVQQLQQQQARANLQSALTHISGLAKSAGLEVSKEHLPHVAAMIARAAMELPDGDERYRAGDHTVLSEAFDSIKPFLEALRKPATVNTAQVKAKVNQLPKRPTGGNAGQPAPESLKPGDDPRKFEASIHAKARAMLENL